jgi:hypothetical protein
LRSHGAVILVTQIMERVARLSNLSFSHFETVGAPSLRFLQGRERCCRERGLLMFSGLHSLQSPRFVMPNLVMPAVEYPPFANCAKSGAPTVWSRRRKSQARDTRQNLEPQGELPLTDCYLYSLRFGYDLLLRYCCDFPHRLNLIQIVD